jgi:hypothetical protein
VVLNYFERLLVVGSIFGTERIGNAAAGTALTIICLR